MANFKNKYQILILIFSLNLIFSHSVYSATSVKQYTNINGLSNNSVNCIFQDSDNKLWIGTWDGLSLFNGRNFVTYRYNSDKHSLSNNIIRHIEESADGSIWIATDFGINKWNKYSNQFDQYFVDESNPSSKKENAFWIGVLSNKELLAFVDNIGLFYFDNQVNKFVLISEFADKTNIKKVIINQENQLYILLNNGEIKEYKTSCIDGKIQLQPTSLGCLTRFQAMSVI